MIKFDGYLTGSALHLFRKRGRSFGRKILVFSFVACAPIFHSMGILLRQPPWVVFLAFYAILLPVLLLVLLIPPSKKEAKKMTPKRIFVDGDMITSVTEMNTETKFVEDVKTVKDHGEFYELVFPFGKISHNFICQKELLAQGTIEEFEALFEGKIVRETES